MKDAAYFDARSEHRGDCWLWTLTLDKSGYGKCKDEGRMTGAHRVSYETFVGPIPEGLHVLHACDTPRCVNPAHLKLGTNHDNIRDRHRKGRDQRGERHWAVKITEKHAREILVSDESQSVVAARYGIAQQTVSDIKTGRLWAHLNPRLRSQERVENDPKFDGKRNLPERRYDRRVLGDPQRRWSDFEPGDHIDSGYGGGYDI